MGVVVAVVNHANYSQDDLWQLPVTLLGMVLLSPLAMLFAVMVGVFPGMLAGFVLLILARFRPLTAFEVVVVAALAAALPGIPMSGGAHDFLLGYAPLFCACVGAVTALLVASIARKRRIVVPHQG